MTDDYKTFLIHYNYDGAAWCLEMPARDMEDAKARLSRLAWATIDGPVLLRLPVYTGPLAAIIVWCRNMAVSFRRRRP